MNFHVYNRELCIGDIEVLAVASAGIFHIGDAETIQLASAFDSPPESLIIGPFVPLTPQG